MAARGPGSAFATAGVRAFGAYGLVPADDKRFPGLVHAQCARDRAGAKLEPPFFAWVHFEAGRGSGEPGCALMLVLAVLHAPQKAATDCDISCDSDVDSEAQ